MSTTAVVAPPAPPAPSVIIQTAAPAAAVTPTTLKTFLKLHETLIIFIVGFALIWFVSGRVEDILAAHDNAKLATTQATLTAQTITNQQTAVIVAQQAADYKALATKLQAQDAALAQANVALTQALTKQQLANNSLTIPELQTRWTQLVPTAGLGTSNGQTVISDAGAHATVNELEKVPVLTTELSNEKTSNANTSALLAASNGQVVTLNSQIGGLNLQLADSSKVCKAQIAVTKAEARKSKRRWFVVGFIAGFASRQAIKSYTGY